MAAPVRAPAVANMEAIVAAPAKEPAAANIEPTGPMQRGRGVRGQYVYSITMSSPLPETVANRGVKRPTDFTREQFIQLGMQVHTACGVDVMEAAYFVEPHGIEKST